MAAAPVVATVMEKSVVAVSVVAVSVVAVSVVAVSSVTSVSVTSVDWAAVVVGTSPNSGPVDSPSSPPPSRGRTTNHPTRTSATTPTTMATVRASGRSPSPPSPYSYMLVLPARTRGWMYTVTNRE